jgi:hypothetical protein
VQLRDVFDGKLDAIGLHGDHLPVQVRWNDRMTPTDDQVRAFLDRFGNVAFAHAREVIRVLREPDPSVTARLSEGASLPELRSTYRIRAEWLASTELPPTFPSTLPEEVRVLSAALDAAADQPIRIWSIALSDGTIYDVFELVSAGCIAGSIKSADQRIVGKRP